MNVYTYILVQLIKHVFVTLEVGTQLGIRKASFIVEILVF